MKKPNPADYDDYWEYESAMYAWTWSWAGPALGLFSLFALVSLLWILTRVS